MLSLPTGVCRIFATELGIAFLIRTVMFSAVVVAQTTLASIYIMNPRGSSLCCRDPVH